MMMASALYQAAVAKKFEEHEASGLLHKLIKCMGEGKWKGYPYSPYNKGNQVGVGDHLLGQSNGRPGPVSALFEAKVNDTALGTRDVRGTVGQTNIVHKHSDV